MVIKAKKLLAKLHLAVLGHADCRYLTEKKS